MGDSRSWAADQEHDRWMASPHRAELVELQKRSDAARAVVDNNPASLFTVAELAFLLGCKKTGPDSEGARPEKKAVERLEELASVAALRSLESRAGWL